ncbi:hypothetical protein VA249_45680 (plasmid) [Vibrio alfacsensis]|uniref:type IV conjugative transfer system lipoprotein TraV n=1 Tax=Vibrio alfacsensis TaxID=1074311 RepID=UPI001BEE2D07|nr:type IV conjugative transfer system lipoprotein TraV [Vibrio alfacsensis]BBM67922.1 hypothetical protein VA249_45680 [Vibrio alfacsensis]
MKITQSLSAMFAAILLGGCAVGQNDFNCSAGDDNALCASSRTIYEATDGELVTNDTLTYIEDGEKKQITLEELKLIKNQQNKKYLPESISEISTYGGQSSYVPHSFSFDGDVLRKDVEVLRVWIAPFVDTNDDLHLSSMVYTDIKQRSWELGIANPNNFKSIAQPQVTPLLNPLTDQESDVGQYRVPPKEKAKLQTLFKNN